MGTERGRLTFQVSSRVRHTSALRLRTSVTVLVIALACVACNQPAKSAAPPSNEMSRAVIDPYLKIADALASDSMDGVTANAGDVATAASALGALAFKIDTAAAQLTGAGDVADARVKFGALSEAIDAYMANNHLTPPEGVRVAFCPMQMKPWLQPDGTLRNPYYGSQMPTCGSFRNN
jgi:hypothetical protein